MPGVLAPGTPRDGVLAPDAAPEPFPRRPHILFLIADQLDGRAFDPASPQLKPPMKNLQALARSGTLFTTSYSQSPACTPSRTSMLTGRRTDQIRVWDNFVGIASSAGNPEAPDANCVEAYGRDACVEFGRQQRTPNGTVFDVLAARGGYNVTLYGKMHVGGGLDTRHHGKIWEWPFQRIEKGPAAAAHDPKTNEVARFWVRGAGWRLNVKGTDCEDVFSPLASGRCVNVSAFSAVAPDNVRRPSYLEDYEAVDGCVGALRSGLLSPSQSTPQLLYCSVMMPHPPYETNATFLAEVAHLAIRRPTQVPLGRLHLNDRVTTALKGSAAIDAVPTPALQHMRRVYWARCVEADRLLGRVLDALDAQAPGVGSGGGSGRGSGREGVHIIMVSDHGDDMQPNAGVHTSGARGEWRR